MYDSITGPNNEDANLARISLGRAKEYSGDLAGAEADYRQAVVNLRELPPRFEGRMAMALINLGNLLVKKGDYDAAISAINEADRVFQKSRQSDFYAFYGKYYLGQAYLFKGDYEKTIEEASKAVDIGRKAGLAETPDFLYVLNYLGLSLTRTGHPAEGESHLRESLALAKRILPEKDARRLATESGLGECLLAQSRFAEAEPLVVNSYEDLKAVAGDKNPNGMIMLKRVIELYEKWNKPELAAKYRALLASAAATP